MLEGLTSGEMMVEMEKWMDAMTTEPLDRTLVNEMRMLIRRRTPLLSTGAYGDEGDILFQIEDQLIQELGSFAMAHLTLEGAVGSLEPQVLGALVTQMEGLARDWAPMRHAMPANQVHQIQELVHQRLQVEEMRTGRSLYALREHLVRALEDRGVVIVVRGDEKWEVLQKTDLFFELGPFIVEREQAFQGSTPCV